MERTNLLGEVFRRLSFRVDYKKEDELKIASVYFFMVFIFLRLLAVGLKQSVFFSLVLTIGALVYLMATFHFVHGFLEKISKKHTKLFNAIFGVLYAITILTVLYLMFAPITISSENTIVSLIVSLLLIILPASFSDEIIDGLKKNIYPIFIAIPLSFDVNMTDVQNFVSGNLPNLTSPFPYFDVVESLVAKFGLPLIIIVVVIALFALKIIKTILQLLLVIIVIWAIAKYLGLF
jgi:hypothetical protein